MLVTGGRRRLREHFGIEREWFDRIEQRRLDGIEWEWFRIEQRRLDGIECERFDRIEWEWFRIEQRRLDGIERHDLRCGGLRRPRRF